MHHNSMYLSGWCEKAGVSEQKFGPMGWLRLKLDQVKMPGVDIPAHAVFVSMDLKAEDAGRVERNRKLFEKIQAGGFITLWDCVIDSYVKKGETAINRRIKASNAKFLITKDGGNPMNLAGFTGKVVQKPNELWAEMHCQHRPGPNASPGDPWPHRSIKIHFPAGNDRVRVGHEVFVAGKVAGKTPAGKDDIIVIASVVGTGD